MLRRLRMRRKEGVGLAVFDVAEVEEVEGEASESGTVGSNLWKHTVISL